MFPKISWWLETQCLTIIAQSHTQTQGVGQLRTSAQTWLSIFTITTIQLVSIFVRAGRHSAILYGHASRITGQGAGDLQRAQHQMNFNSADLQSLIFSSVLKGFGVGVRERGGGGNSSVPGGGLLTAGIRAMSTESPPVTHLFVVTQPHRDSTVQQVWWCCRRLRGLSVSFEFGFAAASIKGTVRNHHERIQTFEAMSYTSFGLRKIQK